VKRDLLCIRKPAAPPAAAGGLAVAYEYTNQNDASADETQYFFDEHDAAVGHMGR
jgi:hypothetical protein